MRKFGIFRSFILGLAVILFAGFQISCQKKEATETKEVTQEKAVESTGSETKAEEKEQKEAAKKEEKQVEKKEEEPQKVDSVKGAFQYTGKEMEKGFKKAGKGIKKGFVGDD